MSQPIARRLPTLLFAALLCLAGCGRGNSTTDAPTQNPPASDGPKPAAEGSAAGGVLDWIDGDEPFNHAAVLNAPILALPESERAWPIYRKFLPRLLQRDWNESDISRESIRRSGFAAFVNQHQRELEQLESTAAMEHLGFVLSDGISQEDARAFQITAVPASPNPPLIKAYLTAVSQLSPGVLVACGAACVRAEQGDAAGATRLLVAAMNICRQMGETPMLIAKRETWRRFGLALRTTERLLRDHPDLFNAKQLRELEQSYASYDDFGLPLEVDGGRVVIDSIRRMADPNGGVSTRLQGVSVAIARAGGKVASLRQEAEFLDDLLRRSAVEYERPIHQRTSWSAHDDLRAKQGTSPMYVSVLMFPAVEFIYHTREFIWQHRDGMLAVLAIHRYRLENKSWPESLEQTGTVPIDRFSGKSLIYRRQGSGFLLYSVGPNGQDDDGAPESWDSLDQLVQVFATSPKLARNSSGDWRFWSSE